MVKRAHAEGIAAAIAAEQQAQARARRPGRPKGRWTPLLGCAPATTAAELATEVYRACVRISDKRGALSRAIREVAKRRRKPVATVKKAAQRYPELKQWHQVGRAITLHMDEWQRRTMGFPEDVMAKIAATAADIPAAWFMQFLRDKRIEYTCPAWFIDAVRSPDWNPLEYLSPK